MLREKVIHAFQQRFGESPAFIIRAPGRVNLIGEHTDYNAGFVLPMAINRAVWMAIRPRPDHTVSLYSLDMASPADFHLEDLRYERQGWAEYVKGVAWVLYQRGYAVSGWEGVMSSDVPIGAGLSSSAALELAVARAFSAVDNWEWQAAKMALVGQEAENKWVGVNCGIMDQMISAAGKANHALLIDCRDLSNKLVPLPAGCAVVILDTATRRGLVDSAYNERRQQCEAAAQFFKVSHLRDVSLTQLTEQAKKLDKLTYQRAKHVVSENERVLETVAAMQENNPGRVGELMVASHLSLRDDFEVSSPALNQIVEIALAQPGCYGARMTGAGFGGCAVALVQAEQAETFAQAVAEQYHSQSGLQPNIYISVATDGAAVV